MSGVVTITLPDGRSWTPRFVAEINDATCIGCGRCHRVCGRDVLQMVGVTEDGEHIAVGAVGDDEEYERKIMTIANQMNCVGCEACAKICPKKCYTHTPMEAP